MATLYQPDGRTKEVRPSDGKHWTLAELQTMIGQQEIEVVLTTDGKFMVVDEMSKFRAESELNIPATRIYVHGRQDVIIGNALVVDTLAELNGPEKTDEKSDG
jgi:hypothetical protein